MNSPSNLSEQMSNAEPTSEPESSPKVIECEHGLPAAFYTSWTWKNPGRRFYRCPVWEHDDYGFFKWYDPWINCYYKELVYSSVQEKKNLKQQVHLLNENTIHNVRYKNQKLQNRLEKMVVIIGKLLDEKKKLKSEKRRVKVVNLLLAFAILILAICSYQYWNGMNHSIAYRMKMLP